MTSVTHSIQNPNSQNTINSRKRRKISENENVDSTNANTDTDNDKHFHCKICTETKAKKERFTIAGCNHSLCIDCTVNYISSKVYRMIKIKIHCPFCMDSFLNVDDCRKILPKEVFDLWGKKLCEAEIPESHKFYCPFKDCSALMIDDGEGRKLRRKFKCPHCDRMFCSQCRVAWHHGIRCKEFQDRVRKNKRNKDDEDDMLMKMAKKKKWQRCPNCKFYVEKTVLVGDMGSGKTSLALRFVKGLFFDNQEPTVGAAFFTQLLSLPEATVKFDIWDTAGQERYHSLAPIYYRGAAAAIVVYDISSTDTFVKAEKWVEELQIHGSHKLVMALVANKSDLEPNREVETEEGEQFAHESGMFYIETSAKTGENINELFYEIAKRIAKAYAPKLIGMKLNNEMQDRRRMFFCCSV
ncbi:hypothetical protein PIB30_064965 [Stylosanthes scabra]|uniref:Uncharacterized protein n=1 Tax=Stylosanthes scabra TaxID=79078 RepID=A0ABU6VK62_9FABA|nr:hypothetical protein [Stylosanthes scabra]